MTGLSLNGNAAQLPPNVLRHNPAMTGQAGSAWFTTLQPRSEGFSTTFTFQTTQQRGFPRVRNHRHFLPTDSHS